MCFCLVTGRADAATAEDLAFGEPYLRENSPLYEIITITAEGEITFTRLDEKQSLTMPYTVEGDVLTAKYQGEELDLKILDGDTLDTGKRNGTFKRSSVYWGDMLANKRYALEDESRKGIIRFSPRGFNTATIILGDGGGEPKRFETEYSINGSVLVFTTEGCPLPDLSILGENLWDAPMEEVVGNERLWEDEDYSKMIHEKYRMKFTSVSSDRFTHVLWTGNADLSEAPGLVRQTDMSPPNIGGWKQEPLARVRFNAPAPGQYKVTLVYSRDGDSDGRLSLSVDDKSDQRVLMTVPGTGSWGDYNMVRADSLLTIPAGSEFVWVETADPSMGDYLMNMKEIILTLDE